VKGHARRSKNYQNAQVGSQKLCNSVRQWMVARADKST